MNILAIDTSTETLGVCLKTDDHGTLQFSFRMKEYKHSNLLIPWLEKLFSLAGIPCASLSLIVCATGPGSFTGLRIGLSTAKGIAAGCAFPDDVGNGGASNGSASNGGGCPLIGVSTLDGIAFGLRAWPGIVVPVIDARKNRVYAAFYSQGKRISDYLDVSTEELLGMCRQHAGQDVGLNNQILFSGPYAQTIHEAAQSHPDTTGCKIDPGYMMINPLFLLEKGLDQYNEKKQGDPETLGPLYLRKSEAEIHQDNK